MLLKRPVGANNWLLQRAEALGASRGIEISRSVLELGLHYPLKCLIFHVVEKTFLI